MKKYRALQIMLEICEGVKAPRDSEALEAYQIIYDMLADKIGESMIEIYIPEEDAEKMRTLIENYAWAMFYLGRNFGQEEEFKTSRKYNKLFDYLTEIGL